MDETIWNEFATDTERLKAVASSIISASSQVPPPSDSKEAAIDKEEEFTEGRILTKLHRRRERNPSAVKKKKTKVLEQTGRLVCEVCEFDFYSIYGDLGKGFAECHHRSPLSDLTKAKTTKLTDLAIVCANCHRMLHRVRPWKTVNELRNLILS